MSDSDVFYDEPNGASASTPGASNPEQLDITLSDTRPPPKISTRSTYKRDNLELLDAGNDLQKFVKSRRLSSSSSTLRRSSLESVATVASGLEVHNYGNSSWDHNPHDNSQRVLDVSFQDRHTRLNTTTEGRFLSTSEILSGSDSEIEVTMPVDDEVARHRRALEDNICIFDEDFEGVDVSQVPKDYLVKMRDQAEELKVLIRTSMTYLKDNDEEFFESVKDATNDAKKAIIQFIRDANAKLVTFDTQNASGGQNVTNDSVSNYKVERVKLQHITAKEKMDMVVKSMETLNLTQVENDVEFYRFDDKMLDSVKSARNTLKECQNLINDALDAKLEDIAVDLESKVVKLKLAIDNGETKVSNLKDELGLHGTSQSDKFFDLEIPKFSGKPGTLDFFSFKKRFTEYKTLVRMSPAKELRVLKVECIKDESLRMKLSRYDSVIDVMEFLEDHYGDSETLLLQRRNEIVSIGRFPLETKGRHAGVLKEKEWLLKMDSSLREIQEIAIVHELQDDLYYSDFIQNLVSLLPDTLKDEYMERLGDTQTKKRGKAKYMCFLSFISNLLVRYTNKVNHIAVMPTDNTPDRSKDSFDKKQRQNQHSRQHDAHGTDSDDAATKPVAPKGQKKNRNVKNTVPKIEGKKSLLAQNPSKPQFKNCPLDCGNKHTHLFYCQKFLETRNFKKRFNLAKENNVCMRCLRLDSEVEFKKRDEWWEKHESNCNSWFPCKGRECKGRKNASQVHATICCYHVKANREFNEDFVNGLDKQQIPSDGKFFTFTYHSLQAAVTVDDTEAREKKPNVIPDDDNPPIFMVHDVLKEGKKLLCFYDGGAGGAAISERAYKYIDSRNVKPGPTSLDVAGGRTILIEGGDEQFELELYGSSMSKQITALKMSQITTPFPLWDVTEAWDDVVKSNSNLDTPVELPDAPKTFGGRPVDILLGIKYNSYFPKELFSLPCGLSVYKSKIKCANGLQAVLGGPHKAWKNVNGAMQTMTPKMFFTYEAKCVFFQNQALEHVYSAPIEEIKMMEDHDDDVTLDIEVENDHECSPKDESEVLDSCYRFYSIKTDLVNAENLDKVGAEAGYRCHRCRNCNDCRKGDILEAVSLQEEREQSQIEDNLIYDEEKKKLITSLPFIKSPAENLTPNKNVAVRVLQSIIKQCRKNPAIIEDLERAFFKLRDKKYVVKIEDLSDDELEKLDIEPGACYIIPWRPQWKAGSLSTPCRLVYDASARSPNGGESLNACLATGKNMLSNLFLILVKFRKHKLGVTADIRMAYNNVNIIPQHYKYQKFLWTDLTKDDAPIDEWVIRTLIYGTRPAGNITITGIRKLSDFVIVNHPDRAIGANVLKDDSYLDDVCTGGETTDEVATIASDIDFTLAQGSMEVKGYTITGNDPTEDVSSDGESVSVLGYAWFPKSDMLSLDRRDIYLEKSKRGKHPEPVKDDFYSALDLSFTKRVLARVTASIYDPLGIFVPVTANIKLHLHEICLLHTDWDEPLPKELIPTWATNLEVIQQLRELKVKRAVVPEDAKELKVDLIVSTDAAEKLAVAAVHVRFPLKSGGYSCQLLVAKSKIVLTSTIPQAELKGVRMGATLGFVAESCFKEIHSNTIYVTDSSICLHWINTDQRPLPTATRNAVIEVRRLSNVEDWYHIDGYLNVADIGTRKVHSVDDIGPDSEWQLGKEWMTRDKDDMPIRTLKDISDSSDVIAHMETSKEASEKDNIETEEDKIRKRYKFSKYLVDPCKYKWTTVIKTRAAVVRFSNNLKKIAAKEITKPKDGDKSTVFYTEDEIEASKRYFFLKATKEVKEFVPKNQLKDVVEIDGILHHCGRILDGQVVDDQLDIFPDLKPLHFVKPIVDRYSPIAYAIMTYVHREVAHHRNAAATLQQSRHYAYILKGKQLAVEMTENCFKCRRERARTMNVEMGKISEKRLSVTPAFFTSQCDLFGPLDAMCEHNHRAKVQVYGVVYKCMSTMSVNVHVMQSYSTEAFLQAFTRHGSRFGYPNALVIDQGSQLVKACNDMKISIIDVIKPLEAKFETGIKFTAVPVSGHNQNGMVERSILEVQRLFNRIYHGLKLDILSYETAFAYISNELNCLPIALGSGYSNYYNLDLITPSRLLHGRNNRRAPSGFATLPNPKRLLQQIEEVQEAWWTVWMTEALGDFVPGNSKWKTTGVQPEVDDIVLFCKDTDDARLGGPIWRVGIIKIANKSEVDNLIREVTIKYKNHNEKKFRTTVRAVRSVAILLKHDEITIEEMLDRASKDESGVT